MPTHREIQQACVDVGDQKPSFVGSSQWIGSQEVGFVLQELLGVECRFLFVASGPALSEHAREIARHFDVVGTPIMMGKLSALVYRRGVPKFWTH